MPFYFQNSEGHWQGCVWCKRHSLTQWYYLSFYFQNLEGHWQRDLPGVIDTQWYYTIIVFCWGQCKFLWTLKMIFTKAFRLGWISISKVHKNSYWPIQKTNCFITLKWKVKVKPSLRDFCKPIACVGHDDYLFILK